MRGCLGRFWYRSRSCRSRPLVPWWCCGSCWSWRPPPLDEDDDSSAAAAGTAGGSRLELAEALKPAARPTTKASVVRGGATLLPVVAVRAGVRGVSLGCVQIACRRLQDGTIEARHDRCCCERAISREIGSAEGASGTHKGCDHRGELALTPPFNPLHTQNNRMETSTVHEPSSAAAGTCDGFEDGKSVARCMMMMDMGSTSGHTSRYWRQFRTSHGRHGPIGWLVGVWKSPWIGCGRRPWHCCPFGRCLLRPLRRLPTPKPHLCLIHTPTTPALPQQTTE